MVKSIRLEIIIFLILSLNVLFSYDFDLFVYNNNSYIGGLFQQAYIKKIFFNITILGDSLWYFSISAIFLILGYFLKKNNYFLNGHNFLKKFQNFNILILLTVFISGVITQIIKHVVGRPRPNEVNLGGEFNLKFFTLDSSFHSFPSGHATTIFAVALVLSLLIPKLRYFFYLLAAIVSLSRVVVEAHFITDVIGGAIIAFIGFKISKFILLKFFNINERNDFLVIKENFKVVASCLLILSIFLTVGSAFDIFFSNLFYTGNGQFLIQSYYFVTIFFRLSIVFSVSSWSSRRAASVFNVYVPSLRFL